MTSRQAKLIKPYHGYSNIELIDTEGHRWRVRICSSALEILVYEDEFILDAEPEGGSDHREHLRLIDNIYTEIREENIKD